MSDSDSDSDLSTPANLPPDSAIEQCLRRVVRDAIKNNDELTINLARSRAEAELGLEAGFFKDNDVWKRESKDIINQAVNDQDSPEKPEAKKPEAKAGTKRRSDEAQPVKKRAKKSAVPDSEDVQDSYAPEVVKIERQSRVQELKSEKEETKSEDESALSDPPEDDQSEPSELKQNGKPPEDDDSDLSSVIDDPPPKKSRQKKKSNSPTAVKSKPTKSSKSSKTKAAKPSKSTPLTKDLTPDEEEIKRLQSWLLKCGIRKVWHRELAHYPTAKEKISHLKKMLDDVGMTPRYSAEKAKQIKEARELKAELEAAREFNEQWGHGSGGESGDGEKKDKEPAPVRRLKPKGLVDFGDSDEESD